MSVTVAARRNDEPPAGDVTEIVGAAASIRTSCELTCPALPALSVEKNLTVAVCGSANGAL